MLLLFFFFSDLSEEHILNQKIVELYERLKHAEMLNLERRSDIAQLRKNFGALLTTVNKGGFLNSSVTTRKNILWTESQSLLADIQSGVDLQLPSIHHFLPHLLSSPDSLSPSVKVSRGRCGGMCLFLFKFLAFNISTHHRSCLILLLL